MSRYCLPVYFLLAPFFVSASQLPKQLQAHEKQYNLCSEFTVRYSYFIKVAHVGYYTPDCTLSKTPLRDTEKILRFKYLTKIPAAYFRKSAFKYYAENVDKNTFKITQKPLMHFNGFYEDMDKEDFYDLIYTTDSGLSLYKNDLLITKTLNPALSSNYFLIWFGEKPVIKKLKKALTKPNSN